METNNLVSIKNKIIMQCNISDVISNFVSIEKKGNNFICVCPFHIDNSPSLSISDQKKIFKCFACNVSGDAVEFVKRFEDISFFEAIKKTANIMNLKIDLNDQQFENNIFTQLKKINMEASKLYNSLLFSDIGNDALNYLTKKRKIPIEIIKKFSIGYCPKEDYLNSILEKNNIKFDAIQKSNLYTYSGNKKYNFYSDRIVFPIFDGDGSVVGFSGRLIDDSKLKNVSKYLNSRENEIFIKSRLLYNINNASSIIKESKNVIILEGFMDVIALEKININNCIALMGTKISDYQIEELSRNNNPTFIIFLDGDDPGIYATKEIIKKLLFKNKNIKIILNKTKKDPDELLATDNAMKLKNLISNPVSIIDFLIDIELIDSKKEIFEILKNIFEVIVFDHHKINHIEYFKKIAAVFSEKNISEKIVEEEFEKYLDENNLKKNFINISDDYIYKENRNKINVNNNNNNNNNNNLFEIDNRKIKLKQTRNMFLKSIVYCFINENMFKLSSYNNIVSLISEYEKPLAEFYVTLKQYKNQNNSPLILDDVLLMWKEKLLLSKEIIEKYIMEIIGNFEIIKGKDINNDEINLLLKKMDDNVLILETIKERIGE